MNEKIFELAIADILAQQDNSKAMIKLIEYFHELVMPFRRAGNWELYEKYSHMLLSKEVVAKVSNCIFGSLTPSCINISTTLCPPMWSFTPMAGLSRVKLSTSVKSLIRPPTGQCEEEKVLWQLQWDMIWQKSYC